MKYSAGLARGKKKKSHILKQCVHVNYAGKQLVNGVSVSEDLSLSCWVFRVKIRFLLQTSSPDLSRLIYTYMRLLSIVYVYANGWMLSLCKIFIIPGMHITDTCIYKLFGKRSSDKKLISKLLCVNYKSPLSR